MIALLTSVPFEHNFINSKLNSLESITLSTKKAIKGNYKGLPLIILAGGIGKVNAAHSATLLCEHFPLQLLINFGVGGAYPNSGLKVGEIALANKEIYGDEGVIEPDGWYGMERIGIALIEMKGNAIFNEFLVDPDLVIKFKKDLGNKGIEAKVGPFVTLSTSSGTSKRAFELENRFKGIICENMEGAAVAHICALYNTPFAEIRGISNIVENRNTKKWDLRLAALNCQKALMKELIAMIPK